MPPEVQLPAARWRWVRRCLPMEDWSAECLLALVAMLKPFVTCGNALLRWRASGGC